MEQEVSILDRTAWTTGQGYREGFYAGFVWSQVCYGGMEREVSVVPNVVLAMVVVHPCYACSWAFPNGLVH